MYLDDTDEYSIVRADWCVITNRENILKRTLQAYKNVMQSARKLLEHECTSAVQEN